MQEKYQIFISYRRSGGEDLARLLEYKLTDRGFKVFFDVESLRSGKFNEALYEKIAECSVVLVVLPPHGLDRCVNSNDWVRLEIARALNLGKKVVPIMMRNFTFPEALPEDIDDIRYMNGINANNELFDATIEKLISHFLSDIKPWNSDEQLLHDAKDGDIVAMNAIGLRYETGSESLPIDRQMAFAFYEQSASNGYLAAIYNLGDVYEKCERDLSLIYDYGIEKKLPNNADEARTALHEFAIDCYTRAANENFAPAMYRLGNLAEDDQEYDNAFKLYQTAANLNYPAALNALGYYKMHGIGNKTISDYQSAVDLYKQAAYANYPPAIYNYAHAMELKDINEAIEMYKRVASIIPQAAFYLAKIYEKKIHDLKSATDYYRVAYEAGIEEAKECLKYCQDIFFNKTKHNPEA